MEVGRSLPIRCPIGRDTTSLGTRPPLLAAVGFPRMAGLTIDRGVPSLPAANGPGG